MGCAGRVRTGSGGGTSGAPATRRRSQTGPLAGSCPSVRDPGKVRSERAVLCPLPDGLHGGPADTHTPGKPPAHALAARLGSASPPRNAASPCLRCQPVEEMGVFSVQGVTRPVGKLRRPLATVSPLGASRARSGRRDGSRTPASATRAAKWQRPAPCRVRGFPVRTGPA